MRRIEMDVAEFIRREMAKTHAPGDTDCCNTADRWVQARRGFSPLERYGRPVRSAADMEAWLSERFGIAGGVLRVMRASGLDRARKPRAGDVGLVRIEDRFNMAIFTGRIWWSRSETGFCAATPERAVRIWRV